MNTDLRKQRFPTRQEILAEFPTAVKVGLGDCDPSSDDYEKATTANIRKSLGPIMYIFNSEDKELGYYVEYFSRPVKLTRDWHQQFLDVLTFYNIDTL